MKKKPRFAGTVIHVSVAAIARGQGQILVEIGLYLPAELAVTYSPRVGECLFAWALLYFFGLFDSLVIAHINLILASPTII
jgi:hypothetical protein